MNNGDGQNNPNFSVNELALVDPSAVVTPEAYANNMQRIQNLKAHLAAYEEKLTTGYTKYRDLEERQRLEEMVRQGELATQLLSELQGRRGPATDPTLPSAGPSNAQQSMFTSQLHGQAAVNYNEVPSSARIVELPSSQESPHLGGQPSTTSSSRNETQGSPSQPRVPVASYSAPQGYTYPYQQFQDWTAFGASPSVMYGHAQPPGTYSQRSSYYSGQWAAPLASHYRPQAHYSGAQVQTPSLAPSSSHSAQQSQSHHTGSQQADKVPQREHVASGASHPPASSSSTQVRMDGANRSNVAQSSGPSGRPGQSSAPGQTQQSTGIPQFQQQQLFQYFQKYSLPEAQALMVQAMRALQRMQAGREKTAAEIAAEGKLKASIVKNAEVIADHLKGYPGSEVMGVFTKYLAVASRRQTGAARPDEGKGASVEKAPPPPQQPVPSTSTTSPTPLSAPPPPPNGVTVQPSATVHPPVSQSTVKSLSSASPAVATPAPSVSAPATSITAAPSTSTTNPVVSPFTQILWYTPQDPNAPIMVRNAKGKIQWLHRQRLPQSVALSTSAGPPAPSTPTISRATAQSELSATPQPRPASETTTWTPEKADRSRLAQDIMRSLGRPKGAFGAPLSPTDTISVPRFEVIHPPTETPIPTTPTVTAKRKASPARSSPVSPTTVKRQRLDGQQDEHAPAAVAITGGPSDASAVEVPTPSVVSERKAESPVAVVASQPAVEQEAEEDEHVDNVDAATPPPADADVDAGGHDLLPGLTDADTVRGVSITSSEAANIERALDVLISEREPEALPDGVPLPDTRASSESWETFVPLAGPVYVGSRQPVQDGIPVPDVTSSPLQGFSAAASNATPPPSSPIPSLREKGKEREKEPLFLPSPSGSPAPSVYDEDTRSDASAGRHLLGSRKGKGRSLDADLDLNQLVDGDEASGASSTAPRKRRRVNRAYILAPPLPAYASSLSDNEIVWRGSQSPSSVVSGSRYGTPSAASASGSKRASYAEEEEESGDELAEWRVDEEFGPVAESEPDNEEAQAAAELAFSRLRETRCSWDGCGIVLNSMATLQRHVVLHANENGEWGTFSCRWKSCLSTHFTDEQSLVRHLQKHARSPLWCAYEDCDYSFASASELLHHHQSSRHRDGQLRKSCCPAPPPENRRQLSPLPDALPAYMFAVRPVRKHPISRDRHQWVGPKVLENITSFKYTGRRSHAGQPSRLSRRLAEKVVAVELASVTPESGHAQIRRWIDDEYLDFADGYDASRRYRLWCADIPAGEVTQMVHDGLALFVNDDDDGHEHEHGDTGGEEPGGGGEAEAERSAEAETDGGLGGGGGDQEQDAADGPGGGEGAAAAEEDGELPPPPSNARGQEPTTRLKLTLPRRSSVIRLPPRPNRTKAVRNPDGDADAVAGNVLANPDQLDGRRTPVAMPASRSSVSARPRPTPQLPESEPASASSPQHLVSVPESSRDQVVGSVWTVWPPAKEESVETH